MEIDRPPTDHGKNHSEKQNWNISFANSRPPLITRVCRESRSLAFENGSINGLNVNTEIARTPGFEKFIDNPWFNPETDIVHTLAKLTPSPSTVNYISRFDNLEWDAAPITPIPYLLAMAEKSVAASITAEFFFPFRRPMNSQLFRGANFHQVGLLVGRKEYFISLREIPLRLDKEAILKSGLFGQFGEERIILLDVEDSKKLRQLYDLWKASNREDDDPEGQLAEFFNLAVLRPEQFKLALDQWRYGVKSHWSLSWKLQQVGASTPDQIQTLDLEVARAFTAEEELELFLEGPLSGWQYGCFEEGHPFLRTVVEEMPIFKPMIMFRLCELGRYV